MNNTNNLNFEQGLSEILLLENVRAKINAASWKEAADIVGQLLVCSEKVEQRYVEKMKQNVDEIGPYIVISPGVALLHARPEDGVNVNCIGLITLVEPVFFGHPENDPVEIVIALGAINKESHIPALQQLAIQLGNPEVIKNVCSANTDIELLNAFLGI